MRQPCGVDMAPCTIAWHGCAQKEHATFARTKPSSSEGFTGKVWSSYVGSAPNFSLYCSLEHPAASSDSFGLFTSVKGNAAIVETAKKEMRSKTRRICGDRKESVGSRFVGTCSRLDNKLPAGRPRLEGLLALGRCTSHPVRRYTRFTTSSNGQWQL